jgi:hypothetical protein
MLRPGQRWFGKRIRKACANFVKFVEKFRAFCENGVHSTDESIPRKAFREVKAAQWLCVWLLCFFELCQKV